MSTNHTIRVGNLDIEVVRKDIKNLHLGVYPPQGRVRVATPLHVDDEVVRLAVVSKLAWIKRQRETLARQPRLDPLAAVPGESVYLFGHRYRLALVESSNQVRVVVKNKSRVELHCAPDLPSTGRVAILERWQRRELRAVLDEMVPRWAAEMQLGSPAIGIRRMRTKWGSASVGAGRIWLNSELAKKPLDCVEYIVVHELAHLIESGHGPRFIDILDKHLPHWEKTRRRLNERPLSHEDWDY